VGDRDKKQAVNGLLKRIRENDLFALGELMELKQPDVRRIAFPILQDVSLCEDLLNDVLIIFLKNIDSFKNEENINGWFNAVTVNLAIDMKRKSSRELPMSSEKLPDSGGGAFEESLINKMSTVDALERMPPLERSVLVDKILGGLTYIQLAEKYDLTKKSIRTVFAKAKKIFKDLYR